MSQCSASLYGTIEECHLPARVYLGLGANLGDREANIHMALSLIASEGNVVCCVSPLYETEPWGIREQPLFLNAACLIETRRGPHALLDALQGIEGKLGRVPGVRNGPRPIDLDILLYGYLRIATPRLVVPHPGMLQRMTVLVPLCDIAPSLRHPITGRTMRWHLRELGPCIGLAPYPPGLVT